MLRPAGYRPFVALSAPRAHLFRERCAAPVCAPAARQRPRRVSNARACQSSWLVLPGVLLLWLVCQFIASARDVLGQRGASCGAAIRRTEVSQWVKSAVFGRSGPTLPPKATCHLAAEWQYQHRMPSTRLRHSCSLIIGLPTGHADPREFKRWRLCLRRASYQASKRYLCATFCNCGGPRGLVEVIG